MAKSNVISGSEISNEEVEKVQEQPTEVKKVASQPTQVIELGIGQVAIISVDEKDENNFIIVSQANWETKYNAGVNEGKFKLLQEKKSS